MFSSLMFYSMSCQECCDRNVLYICGDTNTGEFLLTISK